MGDGDGGMGLPELEELKTRVTEMVNTNRKVDEQLTELDEKIRLLIQNRINLQVLVETHPRQVDRM